MAVSLSSVMRRALLASSGDRFHHKTHTATLQALVARGMAEKVSFSIYDPSSYRVTPAGQRRREEERRG